MLVFFNDTATTEIYTLSLHDALPICPAGAATGADRPRSASGRFRRGRWPARRRAQRGRTAPVSEPAPQYARRLRSEEHTSELQSRQYLVCRLLLDKKKN